MRSLWIATVTAVVAVATASAADGQAVARSSSGAGTFGRSVAGPGGAFAQSSARPAPIIRPNVPRGGWVNPGTPPPPRGNWNGRPPQGGTIGGYSRWGNRIGGRWYGGVQAPGGWNAYRRLSRGWQLPGYWYAPSFFIGDYASYGLGAPPYGYNWSRYYDDAVLIDAHGRVYDSVSGVDWDRYDDGAYDDGADYYADGSDDGYAPEPRDRARRDDGVGGAVIGGVVGGVASNAIAGRGDKLGGTLLGAGVGAVAGAAIDRAEDRGRHHDGPPPPPPPPPHYGADYGPAHGARDYPPPPRVTVRRHGSYGYSDGYAHSYAGGGYYSAGGITVTVEPTVTTTTTTTEIVYADAPVHHRKRVYRAKPRPCRCSKILSR